MNNIGVLETTPTTVIDVVWKSPQTCLEVVPGFEIKFPHHKPNGWIRFWQWVLLGWTWRDLK